MADMDPRDMTSIMGYQKPRTGSQSSSSMDPKKLSLSDMSRDQIRDMAREGSQETRQGEFGSMDAFMQVRLCSFANALLALGRDG